MCYNALMEEGMAVHGTEVAARCTESHINIVRLLDSPRLGRQVNPRQSWLAGTVSKYKAVRGSR